MIEPLRIELDVNCAAEHAFETWTARISHWWPADHTASGEVDASVVLEGRPGGRIFERTTAGIELEWGEITIWEPPRRFGYLWHLRRDRADATEVEIRFVPVAGTRTRVEIEHPAGRTSAPAARSGGTGTSAAGRRCCRTSSRPPKGLWPRLVR